MFIGENCRYLGGLYEEQSNKSNCTGFATASIS